MRSTRIDLCRGNRRVAPHKLVSTRARLTRGIKRPTSQPATSVRAPNANQVFEESSPAASFSQQNFFCIEIFFRCFYSEISDFSVCQGFRNPINQKKNQERSRKKSEDLIFYENLSIFCKFSKLWFKKKSGKITEKI